MQDTRVLVTGAAGFIGYHVSASLLSKGYSVIGLDNLNPYYDVSLKTARLRNLRHSTRFTFEQRDIADTASVKEAFDRWRPQYVINLAAQAGVRYSLVNPTSYLQSNLLGFGNILEQCRHHDVTHHLYASSSSVYGSNTKTPFSESDPVDTPLSLYAATKRSNELMAFSYSNLYSLPSTGLRFFTVYGPYGRPDMAYFSFVDKYFRGEPIHVYNGGRQDNDLLRDFTYIDDVVRAVKDLLPLPPDKPQPHNIYNIGNHRPVTLMQFILTLEATLAKTLGRPVSFEKVFDDPKAGDAHETFASTVRLQEVLGHAPNTPLEEGLQKFTEWYVEFYDRH